jgi:hypothetical protein
MPGDRLAGDNLYHCVKIVRILHLCGGPANRARRRRDAIGQKPAILERAPLRDGPTRPYWTIARNRN